jgi:L-alanine-DL-glutamate epimerase-like enolase superfamily enzyme
MKITAVKVAVIGKHPVVRIATDQGISGYGMVEHFKPYLKPFILHYAPLLLGEDPTNVEYCMAKIRNRGAFKPWGAAISAIEHALWDVAGKAAGLPVYKLLGGKVRDRVRVYNGAIRPPMSGWGPDDYAANVKLMKEHPFGFDFVKMAVAFHSPMRSAIPDYTYADQRSSKFHGHPMRGLLTEKGLQHTIDCVHAMKEVLGDEVGLALDCGPGWVLPDAIKFARAMEPLNLMWIEDVLTGDYVPWVNADEYLELTRSTTTPTHTGEQIYLRHNFRDLIEKRAVRFIGPDPADIGGIAELKWVAEFADMYGIMMVPHGTGNGLLGLAALVQVAATMPGNYVAFEMPYAHDDWWFECVEGLPTPLVVDSHIEVWDRPGMGVELIPEAVIPRLSEEDKDFFA